MNSLFSQPIQAEVLNFQTFSNEYVANRYGISEATIRTHKKLHADEILENIHFITELNKFGTNEVKWTLRGIIKLGMFIRSKEAKNFRLWAEMELEKSILAELKSAQEAKERNLRLIDENSALNLELTDKTKRHKREINGYLGKLAVVNKTNKALKAQLVVAKSKQNTELNLDLTDPKFKPFSSSHPSYVELFKEYISVLGNNNTLKIVVKDYKQKLDKEKQIILNLVKIQKELEKNYTAIGAVMSYINNDCYFLENNEILKG